MSMTNWAENEIRIACKRENPDWDGESFDYGCSCYQSALKAYKSLMDDGHSGYSFAVTKNILNRLMDGHPLTPITEEDFGERLGFGDDETNQCNRMSSLFKEVDAEGNVTYKDINRAYCINVEDEKDTFTSSLCRVVDELFPITLPYYPVSGKYKVYVYTFLCDEKNGDFDHHGIKNVVTPKGEVIEVDDWFFKDVDGKMTKCSKEEFFNDMKNRIR